MTAPAVHLQHSPKSKPYVFPVVGEPDEWGNIILSSRGWYGQYRIKSWVNGREVFVCGAVHIAEVARGSHVGGWRFDARIEHGQGYICVTCWPEIAAQYGKRGRR